MVIKTGIFSNTLMGPLMLSSLLMSRHHWLSSKNGIVDSPLWNYLRVGISQRRMTSVRCAKYKHKWFAGLPSICGTIAECEWDVSTTWSTTVAESPHAKCIDTNILFVFRQQSSMASCNCSWWIDLFGPLNPLGIPSRPIRLVDCCIN